MKRRRFSLPTGSGLVLSVLAVVLSASGLRAEPLDFASEMVRIEGRYAKLEAGGVEMGYPGVSSVIRFSGNRLVLNYESLSDSVYFDIRIDEGEFRLLHLPKGEGAVLLADVDPGEHTVEFVRRTETWQGLVRLLSLEAPGGEFLKPEPLPDRRLLFIGDSITCGESADAGPEFGESGAITSNGRKSYGYVIAQWLNAQCHLVSYGGRGVIRDWRSNRHTNNAPQFYERALADDPSSSWDHQSYIPDAIGICLGTNDFSRGIPDQDEFVNAYVEFVRKIRRDAPEAAIFLIDSPMFGNEDEDLVKRTVLTYYLDLVVEALFDEKVEHVYLGHYPGRPEDAHPLAHEHIAIAKYLLPHFAAVYDGD